MKIWMLSMVIPLIFSCSAKDNVSEGILQPKEMRQIVWEVLQADELALQNKLSDSSLNLRNESFRLYDQVFGLHKISRKQYYDSYQYYQQHPQLYKKLMEEVKQLGEKERKSAQASNRKSAE